MSIDHTTLLKNFQPIIGSYQDVSAIYTKLCSQGQLQKVAHLLSEIYDEEHVFTLTELQNYCKNNNQKEEEFVAEQYELNSNIFRRNLTLIVQSLVEEIGRKFLERFRQDFSSGSNTEEISFKQVHTTEQSNISDKAHYKSHMPEIQEEVENQVKINNNINKSYPTEIENTSVNNKTFDLSISELAQKVQPPQNGHVNASYQNSREAPQEYEQPLQAAQQYERLQAQTRKQISPIQHQREETYENQTTSYYKQHDNSGFGMSGEPTRADDFSQYENEGTFRVSNEKFHNAPSRHKTPQSTGHNWSSPERTNVFVKKHTQSYSQHKSPKNSPGRVDRPDRPDRLDNATASMLRQTYTKWSFQHGRPDPSVLDSEFSYSIGGSFSKSPKRFHYNIQDIPGPGDYLVEEGVQATKLQHPNHSFTKSPKTPAYWTKSKTPGYIYYPVKFFSSK